MTKTSRLLHLRNFLHANYHKRLSTKGLVYVPEKGQLGIEELWSHVRNIPEGVTTNCQFQGCNYQRYPASKFCLYHATGHIAYASKLRASIRRDMKSGVDVSEYEGLSRLVTENIPKRSHHKKRDP